MWHLVSRELAFIYLHTNETGVKSPSRRGKLQNAARKRETAARIV